MAKNAVFHTNKLLAKARMQDIWKKTKLMILHWGGLGQMVDSFCILQDALTHRLCDWCCLQVWLTRPKHNSSSFLCCLVFENVLKVPFKEEKEEKICWKSVYSRRKSIERLKIWEWKVASFWYRGRWTNSVILKKSVYGVKLLKLNICCPI